MDLNVGTVKTISEETDSETGKKRIVLILEATEAEDSQECSLLSLPGEKSKPEAGSRVFFGVINRGMTVTIGVDDGIECNLNDGEKEIYSTSSNIKKASLKLDNAGNITINEGTDNPCLASKVDSFISKFYTMFASWTPQAQDGGTALKSQFTIQFPSAPTTVKSNTIKIK